MRNGFWKGHALGNDYLALDPRELASRLSPRRVRALCDRHCGWEATACSSSSPREAPTSACASGTRTGAAPRNLAMACASSRDSSTRPLAHGARGCASRPPAAASGSGSSSGRTECRGAQRPARARDPDLGARRGRDVGVGHVGLRRRLRCDPSQAGLESGGGALSGRRAACQRERGFRSDARRRGRRSGSRHAGARLRSRAAVKRCFRRRNLIACLMRSSLLRMRAAHRMHRGFDNSGL